ncbi:MULTISPECIES: hypothetical protein [Pseudoalteromonas]|jgi:hypothetical protein|uniref:hypothetical protein n=1 Tax=Pseudoalteromonas TaxID=53246 RepID=UPI0004210430|nr:MULTISPECIES: hypothetical protein [Pseudoalteromonas]TMS81297.1 hypothetical protein CWB65_10440 [Pseudoalteromonas sp. S554]|tara:strand:- start:22 stop:204 length:183 start_codon:yes stop_codon:yes gene_type:complete
MRELTASELTQVDGGVSSRTVAAGARILGRALLSGIAIGTGVGIAVGVAMIAYDVYQMQK